MAAGNGDERQAAAWERVEAKLDRQGEATSARFDQLGDDLRVLDRKLDATRRALEVQIELAKLEMLQAIGEQTKFEVSGVRLSSDARIDELKGSIDALAMRIEALEKAR